MSAGLSGRVDGPVSGATTGPAAQPPGWHGKLPTLGDFASRRLTPAFLDLWDAWLAAGLQRLRDRDPAGWLDAYLAAPSRRFLLMPGALPGNLGAQAWAGVLMPSVDRVGRYFPFTIVQALQAPPACPLQMQSLWHWLGRLDELAADALHDDWGIAPLEAELARIAGPDLGGSADPPSGPSAPSAPPRSPGALHTQALPEGGDIAQHIGSQAQALWWAQSQGLALWYSRTDNQPPSLRVSCGLPATAADLLGATI